MISVSRPGKWNTVGVLGLLGAVLILIQPMKAHGDGVEPSFSGQLTVTGSVTCSWRVNHRYTCRRYDTLESCTLGCVQAGGEYVLMVGEKPYVLKGADDLLKSFAGGKASITGVATGAEIEVSSVSKAH